VRSGPVAAVSYKFEVAKDAAFANIVASGTISEGASQTVFTPSGDLTYKTLFFWHVQAIDAADNLTTPFSTALAFNTPADVSALWPGAVPPGTPGHAVKGDNWDEQDLVAHDGTPFHSPPPDVNRVFDLLDRGMSPQEAIDWLHANGYQTDAAWFPGPQVIGFPFEYMALINGRWDLILKVGA
jgi:hypothetical protein